ncbi:unnamed protein product [Blepharisma stoltei]|uniref:Uncharacterized protein n=1 Tax=Blepharisma stoltei TaxID=1481888 RepID=A0AAU9JD77_9CILI|nr:unnamed protein product [Blepharisma stoltei]
MWNLLTQKTAHGNFLREKESQRYHRSLTSVKSVISTHKPPKDVPRLQFNSKRLHILKDRNDEIEHQNQILLDKMYKIDSKPSALNPINCLPKTARVNSSNSARRNRNLNRISSENKTFFKRLKRAESAYSIEKWNEEEQRRSYLKENISRSSRGCSRKNKLVQDSEVSDLIAKILSRKPMTAREVL